MGKKVSFSYNNTSKNWFFNFKFEFIYLIFIKYFEKNWKEMNRFLLYI